MPPTPRRFPKRGNADTEIINSIPSLDGTLARYCRRKVDKRLAQIVGIKIKRAIEREDRQRNGDSISNSRLKHQPTLPILDDDKHALSRQTTQSTFTQHGPQSPLDSIDPFGTEEQRLNALVRICGPLMPLPCYLALLYISRQLICSGTTVYN